jgi:hypothetical protein
MIYAYPFLEFTLPLRCLLFQGEKVGVVVVTSGPTLCPIAKEYVLFCCGFVFCVEQVLVFSLSNYN